MAINGKHIGVTSVKQLMLVSLSAKLFYIADETKKMQFEVGIGSTEFKF